VLRRIFRPNRVEVIGSWRKLHSEELHDLYCSPSMIKVGEKRNTYMISVRSPEEKRPVGIPRYRWVDKIKMYLREIG
jgi:hypothetical protein